MHEQILKKSRLPGVLSASLLLITLALAGCSSDADNTTQTQPNDQQPATPVSADSGAGASIDTLAMPEQALLTNLGKSLVAVDGAWPGFDLANIPTIVGLKDAQETVVGAITIGHGNPSALGTATRIDAAEVGVLEVYRITDLTVADALQAIEFFAFEEDFGGEVSFVINGGIAGGELDISVGDFSSFLIHEAFHRYQFDRFTEIVSTQDFEGYDFSAENLELAMLEDRLLLAAGMATTDEGLRDMARQFVAVRQQREARDERIILDNAQEQIEGTARYVEHSVGTVLNLLYNTDNHGFDLIARFGPEEAVKEHFGFGRWYATGAAIISILDRLKTPDAKQRIQDGESPYGVLASAEPVTDEERSGVIEMARSIQDPANELPALAIAAANKATTEPPIF